MSVSEQVQQYREHLLRKVFKKSNIKIRAVDNYLLLNPLSRQNVIIHKKQVMVVNASQENDAQLTLLKNQIALLVRELNETVTKKKKDGVRYQGQGLVLDRPESKSETF